MSKRKLTMELGQSSIMLWCNKRPSATVELPTDEVDGADSVTATEVITPQILQAVRSLSNFEMMILHVYCCCKREHKVACCHTKFVCLSVHTKRTIRLYENGWTDQAHFFILKSSSASDVHQIWLPHVNPVPQILPQSYLHIPFLNCQRRPRNFLANLQQNCCRMQIALWWLWAAYTKSSLLCSTVQSTTPSPQIGVGRPPETCIAQNGLFGSGPALWIVAVLHVSHQPQRRLLLASCIALTIGNVSELMSFWQ